MLQRPGEALVGRGRLQLVQQPLGLPHGLGGALQDRLGHPLGLGQNLIGRHEAVDQPHSQGRRGVDRLAQQAELPQVAGPDAVCQNHAHQGRHQSAADLGKSDADVVSGHHQVAGGHQSRPTGVGRPVHGSDGHQGTGGQGRQCSGDAAGAAFGRLGVGRFPQIEAGAEDRPGPAQNHHPLFRLPGQHLQHPAQVLQQFDAQRIAPLGPVERDDGRGRAVPLDDQGRIVHPHVSATHPRPRGCLLPTVCALRR